MSTSKFVPFKEQPYTDSAHTLDSKFANDGYLFFRDLLDKKRVETVRDNIVGVLKAHGFVDKDANSDPIWSGNGPKRTSFHPTGQSQKMSSI